MKFDKKESYTYEDVTKIVDEAKEYGSNGTLKRFKDEYVPKTQYEELNTNYNKVNTEFKTEKFNNAFTGVANKYGIGEEAKNVTAIQKLGNVTIDDTPEQIEEKVKAVKVDYPALFTGKGSIQVLPGKDQAGAKPNQVETITELDQVKRLNGLKY